MEEGGDDRGGFNGVWAGCLHRHAVNSTFTCSPALTLPHPLPHVCSLPTVLGQPGVLAPELLDQLVVDGCAVGGHPVCAGESPGLSGVPCCWTGCDPNLWAAASAHPSRLPACLLCNNSISSPRRDPPHTNAAAPTNKAFGLMTSVSPSGPNTKAYFVLDVAMGIVPLVGAIIAQRVLVGAFRKRVRTDAMRLASAREAGGGAVGAGAADAV